MEKSEVIKLMLDKLNRENDLSWGDISEKAELGFSDDHTRKLAYGVKFYDDMLRENKIANIEKDNLQEYKEKMLELKKKRQQLSDERAFTNKKIRALSRVEDFIRLLRDEIEVLAYEKPLYVNKPIPTSLSKNIGILLLSDIHYGIVSDNLVNKYNPEIAEDRINKLIDNVLDYCQIHNITDLVIFELGDTLSGIIHNGIRLENRFSAAQQVIGISEIISNTLFRLSEKLNSITFTMVEGNHDRILVKKDDNLNEDSFSILVQELIIQRTTNIKNLNIIKNVGKTFTRVNINGFECFGVHGDKDKPSTVCEGLEALSGIRPDFVFMGHFHNTNEYTVNQSEVLVNGSLSGVDEYAYNLRKNSPAIQKFIVMNKTGRLCTYNIFTVAISILFE